MPHRAWRHFPKVWSYVRSVPCRLSLAFVLRWLLREPNKRHNRLLGLLSEMRPQFQFPKMEQAFWKSLEQSNPQHPRQQGGGLVTLYQEQWLGLVQVFPKMENCSPDQSLANPDQLECNTMVTTCLSQSYLKWPNCPRTSSLLCLKGAHTSFSGSFAILFLCVATPQHACWNNRNTLAACICGWWPFVRCLQHPNSCHTEGITRNPSTSVKVAVTGLV